MFFVGFKGESMGISWDIHWGSHGIFIGDRGCTGDNDGIC